jgi:hypothetical protein
MGSKEIVRSDSGNRRRPAALAGLAGLALLALGSGCDRTFQVLVRVDEKVEAPKAVEIVWVMNDDRPAISAVLDYREKMSQYFQEGRKKLSDKVRYYNFILEGEPPIPDQPKECPKFHAASGENLYGIYIDERPEGATQGYLFVEYKNNAKLPVLIYGGSGVFEAPPGISLLLQQSDFIVIPIDRENEYTIQRARALGQRR